MVMPMDWQRIDTNAQATFTRISSCKGMIGTIWRESRGAARLTPVFEVRFHWLSVPSITLRRDRMAWTRPKQHEFRGDLEARGIEQGKLNAT